MYDAVLVPTDGSDGSATAAEHAIDLAQRHNASLHALHVLETEQVVDQIPDFEDSSIFDRLADAGQQAVDDIRTQAADAGVNAVTSAVEQGVPHEEVVDYIERHDIDVVVMATEGRTGPSRELIGSVTESVVRASPVPVLAVKVGGES
ncbi:Nucleotide-binding universal stress protein, UspA family [Haloarcula vallismortis]|uniref:Universal stress protein n=2 Tax=Haloarcula vallismortis TaxID=28442 RepID=M0JNZ9_HALVA|nr:universal stress protein [Haloarcula vallismortis]EMA09410.1 universal stress protein [Haloarcula vallismortis ATCC 29715]SDW82081.1 Nucleotide-binding universal stress protein, UspA family [Haloarcula vallismortis]